MLRWALLRLPIRCIIEKSEVRTRPLEGYCVWGRMGPVSELLCLTRMQSLSQSFGGFPREAHGSSRGNARELGRQTRSVQGCSCWAAWSWSPWWVTR